MASSRLPSSPSALAAAARPDDARRRVAGSLGAGRPRGGGRVSGAPALVRGARPGPARVELVDWAVLADAPALVLALIDADGDRYYLPVAASSAGDGPGARRGRRHRGPPATASLHDAHAEPEFGRRLLAALAIGRTLPGARGRFECRTPGPWPGPDPAECKSIAVHPVGAEQSNTSLRLDRRFILKSLRRPAAGPNPEFEVTHFLATRTSFTHTPGLAGWMDHVDARGERATVARAPAVGRARGRRLVLGAPWPPGARRTALARTPSRRGRMASRYGSGS